MTAAMVQLGRLFPAPLRLLWLFAAAAPTRLRLAVAVAADLDDVAVKHQPVHRRHGHRGAGEDLIPGCDR